MNILYFPRKYNDTDNIVPILHLLLENRSSINLYIYNLCDDEKIFADPNIRFIKEVFSSRVKCYSKRLTYSGRLRSALMMWRRLPRGGHSLSYEIESLAHLLGRVQFQLAFFDHTKDSRYVAQANLLREQGVITVSLPHGIRVTLNQLRTKTDICLDEKRRRIEKQFGAMKCYDRIFYNDRHCLDQMKNLCRGNCDLLDEIAYMGSLRYSAYWLPKKESFEAAYPWDGQKRKVLILPTKPEKNTHWDEFEIALKMMSRSRNVSYVVKPFHGMQDQIPSNLDNVLVSDRYSSSSLIQSADVVMFWATSVVFEALERKKPCIYLSYLHSNHTMFDEHNAAWKIRNRDQLYDCIEKLDDPLFDCRSMVCSVSRDNLLRDVVYNNKECIEDYIDHHLKCLDTLLNIAR